MRDSPRLVGVNTGEDGCTKSDVYARDYDILLDYLCVDRGLLDADEPFLPPQADSTRLRFGESNVDLSVYVLILLCWCGL